VIGGKRTKSNASYQNHGDILCRVEVCFAPLAGRSSARV
jgi:hypothetical protein